MSDEQEIRQKEAERWWEFERDTLSFSKEYGHATVQSLITINGGAIVALLSFLAASDLKLQLSQTSVGSSVRYSLASFGIGLLLAVVVGGLGYLNFSFLNSGLPGPSALTKYVREGDVSGWKINSTMVVGTAWLAVVVAIGSALAFLAGAYFTLQALGGTAP